MNIAILQKVDLGRYLLGGIRLSGQFQSEEEIRNYPVNLDGNNNRTLLPGDFIYKDVNGDGIINGMDERPIGYPEGWAPIMSFGGNIGLQWKGIDLNIDLSGGAMQGWRQNYGVGKCISWQRKLSGLFVGRPLASCRLV